MEKSILFVSKHPGQFSILLYNKYKHILFALQIYYVYFIFKIFI